MVAAHVVHYLILYAATVIASWRSWTSYAADTSVLLCGITAHRHASVPVSYLPLERLHWALIPEFQPTRALLFVTAFAMLLARRGACRALANERYLEGDRVAGAGISAAHEHGDCLAVMESRGVVLVLALLTAAAIRVMQSGSRWARLAALAAILTPVCLIPTWGKVENYPALDTPELDQLAIWARTATPQDAVFLFADAGQDLAPGIFRADALRAIYVDWKSGGQVNFFKDLGEQWWSRWQQTLAKAFDPRDVASYRALGIDYIVVSPKNRLPNAAPAFENARYLAYRL